MNGLLKRDNFIFWIAVSIITLGLSNFYLAHLLHVYEKDAWYTKKKYWCLGFVFMFFPLIIMFMVFYIQICCSICKKLNVPGENVYFSPYSWIICFIVPIVGWSLELVMFIYIMTHIYVSLAYGYGEKYIY